MKRYLVTRTITEAIVVEAKDEDEAIEIATTEVGWETEDASNYLVEVLPPEGKK